MRKVVETEQERIDRRMLLRLKTGNKVRHETGEPSKHQRRVTRRLEARWLSASERKGFHRPGSQNLRRH